MNTLRPYMILVLLCVCTLSWQLESENDNEESTTVFTPGNPVPALENTAYHFTTAPSKLSGSTIQTMGGEQWYTITPSSGTTIVKVTPDTDSDVMFTLYNSEGYPSGSAISIDYENYTPGIPAEYLASTWPGKTYYLCVLPITTIDKPETTVSMIYYPGPADTNEENDSFEQAIPLPAGIPVEGLGIDPDYFVFSAYSQGSRDIEVEIHMIESPGFVLSFYLFNNDPVHNTVYSREYIDTDTLYHTTLQTGGIYYLCISPESWEKNARYSVEWRYR
ncbi:MAG: hypothetical protein JXB88_13690 [Spirochaetales bacterium]|nr:hypothetical protein [Spirochaetales bacterium]